MKTPTEWKTIYDGLTFSEGGDTFEWFIRSIQADARTLCVPPDGWCLVPIEPTKSMIMDACAQTDLVTIKSVKSIYAAMLSAAPKPEKVPISTGLEQNTRAPIPPDYANGTSVACVS